MKNLLINFKNVSKKYHLSENIFSRLDTFFAVKNLSFSMVKKESLGIVGTNGSGKTTIIKLIAKITAPSSGKVTVFGGVLPLTNLGGGFHPELTARENIFLISSIYGINGKSIQEQVIEFSGLKKFMDMPIKRFSTGMNLKLSFSIAIHIPSDIILIDEVIAGADAAFYQKTLRAILELEKNGKTIVFCSHNLTLIEKICKKTIWIEKGEKQMEGPTPDVIKAYSNWIKTLKQ